MSSRSNKEKFISRAVKIHGSKYDYSRVIYNDAHTKIEIICPIHGVFIQTPDSHLGGKGCKPCSLICSSILHTSTTQKFCNKAVKVHGNKYNYSLVVYKTAKTNVDIICKKHGVFKQQPTHHLAGRDCPMCSTAYVNTDILLKRFNNIHGDIYDYRLVEYGGWNKKIPIICPIHGVFLQTAGNHLRGCGCPICKSSKIENRIILLLKQNSIKFTKEKTFPTCVSRKKWRLRFDFYVPHLNLIIEYHGKQHFEAHERFGGLLGLCKRKCNDEYKKRWAIENGYIFKEYNYRQSWKFIEKDINKILKSFLK